MAALGERFDQNKPSSPAFNRKRLLGTPTTPTPKRHRAFKQDKSENVDWKKGMWVFVPDPQEGWLPGVVSDVKQRHLVVTTHNNQDVMVECSEVVLRSSPGSYEEVHDLTKLSPLSTPAVLQCLRVRYQTDIIYSHAGHALVAVNPFKNIPHLYDNFAIHQYQEQSSADKSASPHVYGVAQAAYQSMKSAVLQANQSIIVSGESGAGKTVSAKHLMKYLVTVSSGTTTMSEDNVGCRIERKILDSNPVLEAFGNASTLRNHNSSRFGKYVQLQFNRCHEIGGATIQTYLLEKTRVVHQPSTEHNFHIFYQMLSGVDRGRQEQLGLADTHFLLADPHGRQTDVDRLQWQATQEALQDLDVSSHQQLGILQVLSGILHLGNVEFCSDEEDEDICVINPKSSCQKEAELASDLFGVELSRLEVTFTHRRITASHRRRQSVFSKPCSLQETAHRRDCLAKVIYANLFEWLVTKINSCIRGKDMYSSIGLLDIYGFESFETNSLEQLCINYANEKLQQHYVSYFLRDLQVDYEREAISWSCTEFTDNRPCLELMEGNPGIFALLNEECQLNRPCSSEDLRDRIVTSLQTNSFLTRQRRNLHIPQFVVKHYAQPVSYAVEDLLDKNKDNVAAELLELLQGSCNPFLASLFSHTELDQPGKKKRTVLAKFKSSLDSLMTTLMDTQPHYIRCLKPNTQCKAGLFNGIYILEQLEACGIVETVDISRKGFPTRISYDEFLKQYSLIMRSDPGQLKLIKAHDNIEEYHGNNKENELLFEPLDMLYQKQLNLTPRRKSATPKRRLRRRAGMSSSDHLRKLCASIMRLVFGSQYTAEDPNMCSQFGRTKLFLKHGQLEQLESMRTKLVWGHAFTIQCAWRRYLARRRLMARNKAATRIQAAFHGWHERKLQQRRHQAASVIQHSVTRWLGRLRKHRDVEVIESAATPVKGTENVEHFSSLLATAGLSPVTPRGRIGVQTENHPCENDEGYLVCTERNRNGVTYHIVQSPVNRGQHNAGSSPMLQSPVSKCHCSPLHQRLNVSRHRHYEAASPGVGESPVSLIRTPIIPTHHSLSARTPADAFRTVAAAVTAAFLTQNKFQLRGAFSGIPYMEASKGVLSRRRMPRVQIKFHTQANSLLKYGHFISQQEFQCSLTDAINSYD